MSEEQLLTPGEAGERIGVSDQTIYNWIADGRVQRYRMRGMKRKRYTIPMGDGSRRFLTDWRGGWDSNPRGFSGPTRFRDEHVQPLRHLPKLLACSIVASRAA